MSSTLVIIVVGCLVGVSCALVGSFLVVRRIALVGDAISHAVLPGIVLAFWLSGSRAALPMVVGAGVFGVLTVVLVQLLNRTRRLHEDASIGVVFPALFSLGVIMASQELSEKVDLDVDCVLYGEIANTPLDVLVMGGVHLGPKALWVMGTLLVLNLALVVLFYKELKITSFDPDLAGTLGISPTKMHYLLMTAVSFTIVGAFESVGAILVVAMLIVPPATAYLLTNRLSIMLLLASILGAGAALSGYGLARWADCSISGAMAAAAGGGFLLVFLFSPRQGVIGQILARRGLGLRSRQQLVLLHLAHGGRPVDMLALADRFRWSGRKLLKAVERLVRAGLVEKHEAGLLLTDRGKQAIETSGATALVHEGGKEK